MRSSLCRASGAALLLLAAVPVAGHAQTRTASAMSATDIHLQTVMIPMRDGVRLATDIYRPARDGRPIEGRFPVLLHRTPYDKGSRGGSAQTEFFVRNGYVVVVQDIRGRYHSEGTFFKYHNYDAPDGYDTIEWLAQQPFSDGRTGMWGGSYGAHTQADAAKLNPPHLTTIVPSQGGMSSAWDHSVRFDGAFEIGRQLTWAWGQLEGEGDDPLVHAVAKHENVTDWYAALPFRKGLNPLAIAPNFEDYYLEQATRADYDDYWKGIGMNWAEYYEPTADIPMIHVSGWYDTYLRGSVANYVELAKIKKGPQRLLLGPWTHGGLARSYAGDLEFGPAAAMPEFATTWHLRWFDHFLKGSKNGVENDAAVRVFVMGTGTGRKNADGRLFHGGYWREEAAWPIPGTRFTEYYFHADGSLNTTRPGAAEQASTTYTFDPRDPVPTIGGNVSGRLTDGGYDQREGERFFGSRPPYLPLKARADVVVFQTEPLTEDVEVVGPIVIRLFASSSAVDTDFTAKLVDVYPPSADYPTGFELNLTDAIIRARYRGGRTTGELMQPGQVYEFEIRPYPTGNVFRRGHRIRVDISSSNFPRFDVNPNTGEPLGRNRRVTTADNTIWHSAEHPSHLVLPIVPMKWRER